MTTAQRAYVKFFVLFAALFCAAYALRLAVVPDIVAVAEGEQATWRVEVAFVLVTLENLGIGGFALTLLLATGASLWRRLRPPATP
ncbi:MAG: hypothetical protein ACLP1D_08885 [Xanthobacteraceae bacterium]